jgi:hypothetical protein
MEKQATRHDLASVTVRQAIQAIEADGWVYGEEDGHKSPTVPSPDQAGTGDDLRQPWPDIEAWDVG